MSTTQLVTTGRIDPALIDQEIDRDPRLKSAHTRRGYKRDLARFEAWRGGRPITRLLVEEYAAYLLAGDAANGMPPKSPHTVNRVLSSIRWWARRVGDLAYEQPMDKEHRAEVLTQAERVASVASVDDETNGDELPGRHIEVGELRALMDVCIADQTPAGVRDAALIGLAWSTGLRRFELAGLDLADVEWTGEGEATLTVRGKRDKTRAAYVFNGAGEALQDWLAIRGGQPGPLFLAIDRGGNVVRGDRAYGVKGEHEAKMVEPGLSGAALAYILERRRQRAGVKPLTWHDFRRTFAGELLDRADMVTVQRLMGHSSPTTTSRYDRRPERARRQAAASLHVPYRRRVMR